ncbi:MAG: M14/M99 family metallopeptidase [Thermodesulfobacteriota bacterium]
MPREHVRRRPLIASLVLRCWVLIWALAGLGLALAAEAQAGQGGKPAQQRPGRQHLVYFADTPNELNVYRVFGARDGKTLMLIGGIQGDEPGGFLSADLYADIALQQGNLIVVPRANFYSIMLGQRGPDGDMNRQFGDPVTAARHKQIVTVLKELMAESDLLLNLHDGSGFFRPRWESPQANPRRFGQSIIADTDRYRLPDGRVLELEQLAQRVLAKVNEQIDDHRYRILFNNHRTADQDSPNKEQRLSATFYALTRLHIPAFGVETSKSLPSEAMKIRHHNLVINAFMSELGIVPENPASTLPPPELKYLVVQVNDHQPVVVAAGAQLSVAPGDRIMVQHIEANYERGLTCDVQGVGGINDLRQRLVIRQPTTIVVRKDNQRIGDIRLQVAEGANLASLRTKLMYFMVEVEGGRQLVAAGERLRLVRGDALVLVDVLSNLANQADVQVNFKGYVPAGAGNQGEDRGHVIDTAKDLMERYSACPAGAPPETHCYRVVASRGGRELGSILVEVAPARLDYLVLRHQDGHKLVYHNGETVRVRARERLELMDLKSNVRAGDGLTLALEGRGRLTPLPGGLIDASAEPLRGLMGRGEGARLVVMRDRQAIGHVRLTVGE